MYRREINRLINRHRHCPVLAQVEMGHGYVYVPVIRKEFQRLLMAEYSANEDTGLTAIYQEQYRRIYVTKDL